MKLDAEFREYLTQYISPKTHRTLSPKVARDTLSRCRKIEKLLSIELSPTLVLSIGFQDEVRIRVKSMGTSFCASPYRYNQELYALRLYCNFIVSRTLVSQSN
jgi:hypothetical protein